MSRERVHSSSAMLLSFEGPPAQRLSVASLGHGASPGILFAASNPGKSFAFYELDTLDIQCLHDFLGKWLEDEARVKALFIAPAACPDCGTTGVCTHQLRTP